MTFKLSDLRKSSASEFAAITTALTKTTSYAKDDEGFFKLEKDKVGNGQAVIRFLPKHPEDDLPWAAVYTHAFQGPTGRWYIENSRTTLGEEDPVSEANRKLWATGAEVDKKQAQKQKRKLNYVVNILVVSNPANPSLEGKVMRFKIGKKIHDKIKAKISPEFADEKACNVFDVFEGADFKLRMKQVEGYPNYDSSVFADPSPIASTDEAIQEILDQIQPLKEFLDPSKFKSYKDLETKFNSVMNAQVASTVSAESVAETLMSIPVAGPKSAGKVVEAKDPAKVANDADDIENYFRSIAG